MVLAPVAFQRVCHGIETGVHGGARRHGIGELRIYDRGLRHEDRVVGGLLLGPVRDHRHLRHFAAGAGRGGHGNDREALTREGFFAAVVVDRFPVAEGDGCRVLRRVDGAAAADADHRVGARLTGEARRLRNTGKLRILLHTAEDGDDAAVFLFHRFRRGGKVPSAGDHTALKAQFFQDAAELSEPAGAEPDPDRLGIHEFRHHRCSPRSRSPWRQTCACWLRASLPDPGTSRC